MKPETIRPGSLEGYRDLEQQAMRLIGHPANYVDEYVAEYDDNAKSNVAEYSQFFLLNSDALTKVYFGEEETIATKFQIAQAVTFACILITRLRDGEAWHLSRDICSDLQSVGQIEEYFLRSPDNYLEGRPLISEIVDRYLPHVDPDPAEQPIFRRIIGLTLRDAEVNMLEKYEDDMAETFELQLEQNLDEALARWIISDESNNRE